MNQIIDENPITHARTLHEIWQSIKDTRSMLIARASTPAPDAWKTPIPFSIPDDQIEYEN